MSLENEICVGYGGLVYINWENKTAEISFLIDTKKEKKFYKKYWKNFLIMLESIAFKAINLNEIYTYAYNIRKHLYAEFEKSGFTLKKKIKNKLKLDNKFIDIVIHSKKKLEYEN